MMYVVKKLGCSALVGKTVVKYLIGDLSGPIGWVALGIDVATTVATALAGGVGVFIKKAMEMGLKQAVKKLVAKQGLKAAVSF